MLQCRPTTMMTQPGKTIRVRRRMRRRRLLLPLFVSIMSRSVSALSASPRRSGADLGNNLRIELFFSSAAELSQRVQFLKSKGVVSYNLVRGGPVRSCRFCHWCSSLTRLTWPLYLVRQGEQIKWGRSAVVGEDHTEAIRVVGPMPRQRSLLAQIQQVPEDGRTGHAFEGLRS